jgi:hypothetical protein
VAPSERPLQARVAAVIVQYLPTHEPPMRELNAASSSLEKDDASRALFMRAYEVYDHFCFEKSYASRRTVSWLGRTHLPNVPSAPGIGPLTANHMLVRSGKGGTTALHHHIALGGQILLDGAVNESTATMTRTLHELFWHEDPRGELTNWVRTIDPFHALAHRDGDGPFSQRAIYSSIVLDRPNEVQRQPLPDWRPLAVPLYQLLNLHAEGVDPANALSSLADCTYSSTEFFTGFIYTDAAVSLAVPYPAAEIAEPWPILFASSAQEAKAVSDCWDRRVIGAGDRFEDYDLSTEYPALRCNAMALLEFAGNAVYQEWRIRRELDLAMRQRWPLGLISAVAASRRIDQTFFSARSPGMLRLRVVRETAINLLSTNTMEESERAIEGLRGSLTNGLLALLAAVAVLLTIAQIAIALLGG